MSILNRLIKEGQSQEEFDLQLDRWHKVSTIVLGIIGMAAAMFTLIAITLPNNNRESHRACLDDLDKIKGLVSAEDRSRSSTAVQRFIGRCPDFESFLMGATNNQVALSVQLEEVQKRLDEAVKAVPELENTPIDQVSKELSKDATGYVSLGPAETSRYPESNFRNTESKEEALKDLDRLIKGTVLSARWSVNLRKNTEYTEGGTNPSLGIIYDEQCVELLSVPIERRGNYWAEVKRVDCPSGG